VTAALIAEALAAAERETQPEQRPERFITVRRKVSFANGFAALDSVIGDASSSLDGLAAGGHIYAHQNVVDAALRHLAERVERAEESAASLRDALAAVFEIAAGCDGAEFESVFSIAHDALAACKGCFPEGGPSRPLVPTVAVEQAEARTKSAKAEAWALREALRKVQICCQYTGTQQILMVACDVKAIVNSALASKGEG
jgi:hypothetical protein